MTDTIFALATGRPPAAVSIVRVSGPRAHDAGIALAGSLPEPRHAAIRQLRSNGELLDEALVLRFDRPASFTGEDIVEFQCHGGRAVVDSLLRALAGIEGLREARPGEFTRRAFELGRIDLTEAEGLADLIEAETESQRKAALAMAEGGLRRKIDDWRQRLLILSARAEAAIDYAEEDDIGGDAALGLECLALASELADWLARPRVEPLKDGVRVVVAGPPNAGKSSLVNALAGSDRAIVTDIAGTTRDHIDVPLSVAGLPVLLTDTAGLRDSDDAVETIGVGRARNLLERADILLWLGEPADSPEHPRAILVHPRADQAGREVAPDDSLPTSTVSGQGIADLLVRIGEFARAILPAEGALALNRRQAALVQQAHDALQHAGNAQDFVLQAEDLRVSRETFDRLTGHSGVEDVLDSLFGRFCLGK
ncbi:MAG TPA: tRNA uridine-5-carboxymethylaminomethyl(34) synthesis GTPase MnmE [Sphingomicrobium sp.]|nr:tRNA uridine-5-carboxymethylaminomethyl(34) synthesis GTPase MnmE [Sphingomicrobium sp.]